MVNKIALILHFRVILITVSMYESLDFKNETLSVLLILFSLSYSFNF